jgi:hypothetical protein
MRKLLVFDQSQRLIDCATAGAARGR